MYVGNILESLDLFPSGHTDYLRDIYLVFENTYHKAVSFFDNSYICVAAGSSGNLTQNIKYQIKEIMESLLASHGHHNHYHHRVCICGLTVPFQ